MGKLRITCSVGCTGCGEPLVFDSDTYFYLNAEVVCPCGTKNPRRLEAGEVVGTEYVKKPVPKIEGRGSRPANPPARIIAVSPGPDMPGVAGSRSGGVSRPRVCTHLYPKLTGVQSLPVCANCGALI